MQILAVRPPKFKKACAGKCQEEYLIKSGYFAAIGSSNVKTVADRHRHTAYQALVMSFLMTTVIILNPQNRGF